MIGGVGQRAAVATADAGYHRSPVAGPAFRRAQFRPHAKLVRAIRLSQLRVMVDERPVRREPGSPLGLGKRLPNLPRQ